MHEDGGGLHRHKTSVLETQTLRKLAPAGGRSRGEKIRRQSLDARKAFFYRPPDFYRSGAVRVATAVYR
jgi:hypothetical protein